MRKHSLRSALADELRSLRRRRQLTQEELAFRSRLHRNYVSLLERGLKSPTVDVLQRVAQALGVKGSAMLAKAEGRAGTMNSHE